MTDLKDRELLESAINGDLDSFGELCSRYYSAMTVITYSILADHHLAEDAVQESFAKALLKLSSLKRPDRFAYWLACICRNTAKDIVKTNIRLASNIDLQQQADIENNDETNQVVREAINKLPDSDRELIILRYYNNLSQEHISHLLGISKSAVNSRLGRAKQKLMKYLERDKFLEDIL